MDETVPVTAMRVADLDVTRPLLNYPVRESRSAQSIVDKARIMQFVKSKASPEGNKKTVLLDARSPERFVAKAPEPRPNLRGGHMPGAQNLFFMNLLSSSNIIRLKSPAELKEEFAKVEITDSSEKLEVITTCGSGATACTLLAGLVECGLRPNLEESYLYDASWMEWGADPNTPIVETDE